MKIETSWLAHWRLCFSEFEIGLVRRAEENNQDMIAIPLIHTNGKDTNSIEDEFTVTVIEKTSESNVPIALQQADYHSNALFADDKGSFIELSGKTPTWNEFLKQKAVDSWQTGRPTCEPHAYGLHTRQKTNLWPCSYLLRVF